MSDFTITSKKNVFVLLGIVFPLLASSASYAQDKLSTGQGSFVFKDEMGNKDKPITIWYYQPQNFTPDSRIVFVMHGTKRKAENYRKHWIEHAEKYNFLLLCPEFSKEYYPTSRQYNQGNIFSDEGMPVAKNKLTFSAIEHIFDYVKEITNIETRTYSIYGHSAGGQFVHRMLLFLPEARIDFAIAANAGVYTMPSFDIDYPYGLKNSAITEQTLKTSFNKKMVILLGKRDINQQDDLLPDSKSAMAQGKHRLERGYNFFRTAKKQAKRIKAEFNWHLQVVPEAGHRDSQMAKTAAMILFQDFNKN